MLRAAAATTSAVAKRGMIINSSRQRVFSSASFHTTARREEEEKTAVVVSSNKGGLFGTGYSEWYALPIGIAAAVPMLAFDWYVVNEETQLAAVFIAFCCACYFQGGDAIYKTLEAKGHELLKEHTEAEDKVIEALEEKISVLKANDGLVEHFYEVNKMREQTYANLNAAGAIKPQYDFKAQIERVLHMIVAEETSVTEKTKIKLMAEATNSVRERFSSSKQLKKAALDSAIAQIKGKKEASKNDPVREAFVKFFKDKATSIKESGDGGEEQAQRDALLAKLNSVCKNENFFFQFGKDGQPKMSV